MLRYIFMLTVFFLSVSIQASAEKQKTVIFQGDTRSPLSLSTIISAALDQPDIIEMPVLLTKDNVPVVFNELFLHPQTNVAELFPARKRSDGNFYFVDFLWKEVQQLSFSYEILGQRISGHLVKYEDAAKIAVALSRKLGRKLSVMPVIKFPWFFTNEGKDISSAIIQKTISLADDAGEALYVKCFDPDELQRIHKEILPGLPVEILLIQGIDIEGGKEAMRNERGKWASYSYAWMTTRLGIRVLTKYAHGIFLSTPAIAEPQQLMRMVEDSHALNLKVFSAFASAQMPPSMLHQQFDELLYSLNLDGLALYDTAKLTEYLEARQADPFEQTDGGDIPALLSNPEELSRRLKQIDGQ